VPEKQTSKATSWTADDAVAAAERLQQDTGLPLPKKPAGFGGEYEFPPDPTAQSSVELAKLTGYLTACRGYLMRVLGMLDVKLVAFETIYEILLGAAMAKAQGEKREIKEILKAKAIIGDDNLRRMTQRITELKAQRGLLKMQDDIYAMQNSALSREQSRRSDEIRERASSRGGM